VSESVNRFFDELTGQAKKLAAQHIRKAVKKHPVVSGVLDFLEEKQPQPKMADEPKPKPKEPEEPVIELVQDKDGSWREKNA